MAIGDIQVIPFALGTGRAKAHQAAIDAFVDFRDALGNWAHSKVYEGHMAKLHLSLHGVTQDFPEYQVHGVKMTPNQRKKFVIPEASVDILEHTDAIMQVVLEINGKDGPQPKKVVVKMAKKMAHATLSWFDRHVMKHIDEAKKCGPMANIINLNTNQPALLALTSVLDSTFVRTVWMEPGDMVILSKSLRYVFYHAVYRLMPGDKPSKWQEGLNPSTISEARSIYNLRLGECDTEWLKKHLDCLQDDEDELDTESPPPRPLPKTTRTKRSTVVVTKPKAIHKAPIKQKAGSVEVPESRNYSAATILETVGNYQVTSECRHRHFDQPVFKARMVFTLNLYRLVRNKGAFKVLNNQIDLYTIRVLATAMLSIKSATYRVLIITMQKGDGAIEGPHNVCAHKMPLNPYYTFQQDCPPSRSFLLKHLRLPQSPPPKDWPSA
jgi:hypothetical protein